MFLELFMEVFFIKVKIKSCLKNINKNTQEIIDTFAIKSKNTFSFYKDNVKYKLINNLSEINLIRETNDFIHKFDFISNKQTKSEYYIKEYNTTIEIDIITTKIIKDDKKIEIDYKIVDTDEVFNYTVEMSDY